ncbi:MAG: methyltransferase domain-containing protein [Methylophilaceae bacterium]|nr:methyltransferase domain-containing protein [Methylophilaceae bacterium]
MSIDNQQQWLATTIGAYLLEHEQVLFDEAVSDVFGFNALQIGMLEMDLLRNSRMPFSCTADGHAGEVHCEVSQLPFLCNSIDLLLLPHALDFTHDPHQALREAERVLVPEGHLMLTGFNPISLWGLTRLGCKHDCFPWNANFIPLLRIKDWLALLGFDMVVVHMACYVPPLDNLTWLDKLKFLDKSGDRWWPMMGGVYFLVAKKKVPGMRIIRPAFNKFKLNPGLLPTPTQKSDDKNGTNTTTRHGNEQQ